MIRRFSRLLMAALAVSAAVPFAQGFETSGPAPLRIVAFGTSLTARGGWQAPLEEALGACLGRPVDVETIALSGSTSEWAKSRIAAVTARRPDIVLVEFSANDAALDRLLSLSGSRENMAAVFDGLREGLPGAEIYDMAMNPIIGLRGWMRPFLADYIDAHRDLALERGLHFVDFRPLWAAMPEEALDAALPDGSHPRPEVAGAIIVPELVRRIAGPCQAKDGAPVGGSSSPDIVQGEKAP